MKKIFFLSLIFLPIVCYSQYGVGRGFLLGDGHVSCNNNKYNLVSIDKYNIPYSEEWYDNKLYYKNGRPKKFRKITNVDLPSIMGYDVSFYEDGSIKNIIFFTSGGGNYSDWGRFYSESNYGNSLFKDETTILVDTWKEQFQELSNYYFCVCDIDKNIDSQNMTLDDEINGLLEYDKLLNRYYKTLKKQFSKSEFQKIKTEQKKWLEFRGELISDKTYVEYNINNINFQLQKYRKRVEELIDLFHVKNNLEIEWRTTKKSKEGQEIEYINIYGEYLHK